MKVFNFLFPFGDFCYILQQEEYDLRRYLKWLPRFFFRRGFQVRDKLRVTKRVKIMMGAMAFVWILGLGTGIFFVSGWWWILWVGVKIVLVPIDVLVGAAITQPYFEMIKAKRRKQAREVMRTRGKGVKIVVVAGSYGKTTTKNFIYQLCRHQFKTVMIPGNINTPAGIADWVINNFLGGTEVLVAEVDAFYVGEIKRSLEVITPDIAVLTNIGDQHLERFGGEKGLALALADTFVYSKPGATLICSEETRAKLPEEVGKDGRICLVKKEELVEGKRLSESNRENLEYAVMVARELGVEDGLIRDGVRELETPERRQYVGQILGYEGIDDSYNISFTTAQAGLKAAKELAVRKKKKLLVVTAGIPELSAENRDKNEEYGLILGKTADEVVILDSMLAEDVLRGLGGKARVVESFGELVKQIQAWYPAERHVLLLQPELTDLYY